VILGPEVIHDLPRRIGERCVERGHPVPEGAAAAPKAAAVLDHFDRQGEARTRLEPLRCQCLTDRARDGIGHRIRIADHAVRRRLPTVFGLSEHAEAGGLLAYEASRSDRWRRAATYVDKILKGAKPADDLPVEQPTQFEFVINLKTAKALGLTIPPSLLQRADQVLE
jgi:hypothetical protein